MVKSESSNLEIEVLNHLYPAGQAQGTHSAVGNICESLGDSKDQQG